MRTQTFIVSMAGVLMFAGTLVATQTASAAIVWDNVPSTESEVQFYQNKNTGSSSSSNLYLTGTDLFAPATMTWGAGSLTQSISGSGFTPGGFSYVANITASDPTTKFIYSVIYFTATSDMDVTISWNQNAQSLYQQGIAGLNATEFNWTSTPGYNGVPLVGSQTMHLDAGEYELDLQATLNGNQNGDIFTFAVPAPGAAALIGLAGLVATRRRRN